MYLTRKGLAERHGCCVRSIARRQAEDPDFPQSVIIRGRHFFDLNEIESFERRMASTPRMPPKVHQKLRPIGGQKNSQDAGDADDPLCRITGTHAITAA